MSNGDKAVIRKAEQPEYKKVATISNVTANAYDYTVSGSPDTPATGTINATGVIVDGLTNGSGVVSASASFSVDQALRGRARLSTSTPRYKSVPPGGFFTDTVDSVNGLTKSIAMVRDD